MQGGHKIHPFLEEAVFISHAVPLALSFYNFKSLK